MIKVEKNIAEIPASIVYNQHIVLMCNLLQLKNSQKFSGYNKKDVKDKLTIIYNNKCAYCESKRSNAPLQIEHYRPKKEVDESQQHTGYYWLAYEWYNLLLSCPDCNSQSAKGNHFPIEAIRINAPSTNKTEWNISFLNSESPLLLNPEIDNPDEHLEIKYDGELSSKTERGRITIEICKLNRSGGDGLSTLKITRKSKIDEIFRTLKEQMQLLSNILKTTSPFPNDVKPLLKLSFIQQFELIKTGTKPSSEFSILYKAVYLRFNDFIDNVESTRNFNVKYRELLKKAFELYKNGKL